MNAALRRMGHDVDEIWGPELGRRIRHGNLHYLLELPVTYRSALRRRLALGSYDVVEFNQPHAYLAAAEFRGRRSTGVFVNRSHGHEVRSEEALSPWRRELGIQTPGGLRGWTSRWIRTLLDRQWKRIAESADGFHVSSRDDAKFIHDRYGVAEDRIGIVTQGIPDVFATTPAQPMTVPRRQRMLYVGQLAFFKAPPMLARAASAILEKHPQMTMTWVCSQTHHAEAAALLAPGVRGQVRFLDWMSQEALLSVLDEHGLFLFPSFFEGFGKAPLEAMSRGLCVVASDAGGMRDFIHDGGTGRLVPIGRPDLMAAAVEALIQNPEHAEAMSQAARASAVQHRWDRCAADLTDFYRRLLSLKHSFSGNNPPSSVSRVVN